MPLQQQTVVRNTEGGPAVLSSDAKGTHFIEWAGAGDPNGNDVQIVPDEILNTVAFSRAVQRGILVLENPEDNPELTAALERQNVNWRDRRQTAAAKLGDTIERPQNNDLVVVACIGPDNRGQGNCGNDVPVREGKRNDAPPLCTQHTHLAPQYVPQEGTTIIDGKAVTTWARMSMSPRQTQE